MNNHSTAVDSLSADRPEFSDRGDSAVVSLHPKNPAIHRVRPRKQAMTDEELMASSGLEPIFSTAEAAEFFDRSNQWLYWGLRNGVFEDAEGNPLNPERMGSNERGRRKFTVAILRDILNSSYRRGNFSPEELKVVTQRLMWAEKGIDWRQREGWRYAHLGRNRYRWIRPEEALWDSKTKKWIPNPEKVHKKPRKAAEATETPSETESAGDQF